MIFLKKRAVIYIRYSSENQRDGYSIEYQKEECKKYLEANNYELVDVYIDEAVSGKTTDNRNAFFKLLADVKKGICDAVVVYKYSRFARNLMEARLYHHQIEKAGVKLISAMEQIDDSTPEGRMMRNIIMTMDEYYSDNLSTFVQSSMYTAAKKGKYLGGIHPFGFAVDEEGNFIENKREADIVRRIFELRASGVLPADILRIFQNEGITSRDNKPFTQQLLNKIVRSEKYIGTYKYKVKGYEPISIPNAFEPIIDMDTWNRVQIEVDKNNHKKVSPRQRKNVYPLTGKIYCAICGEPFTGNSKGVVKKNSDERLCYYTCRGQDKLQICKNGSIEKNTLEEFVFSKVKELILQENLIDDISRLVYETLENDISKDNVEDDILKLKKDIKTLEKKQETLLELMLEGELSKELLNNKTSQINKELASLKKALIIKEHNAASVVTLENIKEFLIKTMHELENADDLVKKAIASQFIDKIIVHEDHVNVRLTVAPLFIGDKINKGWALFSLSPKRKKNHRSYTHLYT